MNRRPGHNNRRVVQQQATIVTPSTPATIVTSRTMLFWLRSDFGVVEGGGAGTGVTQWQDQSGNARHANQVGGAGTIPSLANDGPNSRPMLTFDGSDDVLALVCALAAPGTTPTFIWAVIKSITHTASDAIWCAQSTSRFLLTEITGSGNCRISNPTAGVTNANFTAGQSRRFEALYSGSTSDRLKVGSVNQTGTNVGGANTGTGLGLASVTTGGNYANVGYLEIAAWSGGDLSPGELADLDTYASGLYGSGVIA